MFNNVPIKGHVKCFVCIPVIFQSTLLIKSQLHKKGGGIYIYIYFFFEQSHQAVGTVLCPMCPTSGDGLCWCLPPTVVSFQTQQQKKAKLGTVFSNVRCLLVNSLGSLVNL